MRDWENVIGSVEQGVLVCDKDGRIEYFNDSYAELIGHDMDEAVGMMLTDLRPGAAVPRVLSSGEAIRGLYRVEQGKDYFADIYPILEDGRVEGTVSVVTFIDRANFLKDQLEDLKKAANKLKARMSLTNGTRYTFDSILGDSLAIRTTVALAKRVAEFDSNVLLQGESGVGKELFAQAIHNASARRDAPFVAVNCAAISRALLESELFGYEGGSFTGAVKGGKTGLFEAADGGTVFLDEVSEMDYDLQAKLLRVLQEKKFRRIGGIKEIEMNVRVICACNVDLLQYISEKRFRSDLYYRISVAPINVPPLRERREDIPPLAANFMEQVEIQNKRSYRMTEKAKSLLMDYTWPGNIRELRNTVEYVAMMAPDGIIDVDCLPPSITSGSAGIPGDRAGDQRRGAHPQYGPGAAGPDGFDRGTAAGVTLSELVSAFEKQEIRRAVRRFGDSTEGKREAARALGISLSSLYAKLGKK